jgi:hypothetical protein
MVSPARSRNWAAIGASRIGLYGISSPGSAMRKLFTQFTSGHSRNTVRNV